MLKLSHFLLGYFVFLLFGTLFFYELNSVEEKKRHINVNRKIQQFIVRNKQCLKGKLTVLNSVLVSVFFFIY